MKTILIINDQSPEAENAASVTLALAEKIEADIILATKKIAIKNEPDFHLAESSQIETVALSPNSLLMEKLLKRKKLGVGFSSRVQEVELSDNVESLSSPPIKNDIYLMVKGIDEFLPEGLLNVKLAIDDFLKKLQVPLLLIPSSWSKNKFERMAYLTDLRYCGIENVRFLAKLAVIWKADLAIGHRTASGLPNIQIEEATRISNEEIGLNVNYKNLILNMLSEEDLGSILEIMVDRMNTDLLVLVNQHLHFSTFLKQYFKNQCSTYTPVPILIFPV